MGKRLSEYESETANQWFFFFLIYLIKNCLHNAPFYPARGLRAALLSTVVYQRTVE